MTRAEIDALLARADVLALTSVDMPAMLAALRAEMARADAAELSEQSLRFDHLVPALSRADAAETEVARLRTKLAAAREAVESIANAIAFSSHDWSVLPRDAWIYGLVCGWGDEAEAEVTRNHKWTEETVARLRRLRAAIVALEPDR